MLRLEATQKDPNIHEIVNINHHNIIIEKNQKLPTYHVFIDSSKGR